MFRPLHRAFHFRQRFVIFKAARRLNTGPNGDIPLFFFMANSCCQHFERCSTRCAPLNVLANRVNNRLFFRTHFAIPQSSC